MAQENKPDFPKEIKRLIKGIKDSLKTLRPLLLALIALLITIGEKLVKSIERLLDRPSPQPSQASLIEPIDHSEGRLSDPDSEELAEQIIQKNNPQSKLDGSNSGKTYIALATISTISLVIGVSRLAPIAQWTKMQNECIEEASNIEGLKREEFIKKVQICNGGHE